MVFRRFIISFIIVLMIFIALNALIWFGWNKDITNVNQSGGDLLRIGYILGHKAQRQNIDDLPKRHIRVDQYKKQHIDMITVGDSFSIGGGGGRNSYYQDYIATMLNFNVLNIPVNIGFSNNPDTAQIETIAKLINSGYLDIIKPKYLLFESVERSAIKRLTESFSLQPTTSIKEIESSFSKPLPNKKCIDNSKFHFSFINNGNWKFIGNNLQFMFRDEAKDCMVIISKLNRIFFSSTDGDHLIFYREDIKNCNLSTPTTVAIANQNLNSLAKKLKSKGISLIFMPAVDKLNLYRPYLKNETYPHSVFFEELRKLPKEYLLIDTKAILSKALEDGELDLFHKDDSHWTFKASERIFSNVHLYDNK